MGSLKLTLAVPLRDSGGGDSEGLSSGWGRLGGGDSCGNKSRDLTGSGGGRVDGLLGGRGGESGEMRWLTCEFF